MKKNYVMPEPIDPRSVVGILCAFVAYCSDGALKGHEIDPNDQLLDDGTIDVDALETLILVYWGVTVEIGEDDSVNSLGHRITSEAVAGKIVTAMLHLAIGEEPGVFDVETTTLGTLGADPDQLAQAIRMHYNVCYPVTARHTVGRLGREVAREFIPA